MDREHKIISLGSVWHEYIGIRQDPSEPFQKFATLSIISVRVARICKFRLSIAFE